MRPNLRLVTLLICTALAADVAAQTTVNDLKAPSSPAVTILGTSPTAIERPDTPQAVVFNLASSIADAGGIPQNYAMQVAPYWLRSQPDLLFESYIRPTIAQSIARSFAVSVATADWTRGTGKSAEDLGSRLAVGFGTVIIPGELDPAYDTIAKGIQTDNLALIDLIKAKRDAPLAAEPRLIPLRTAAAEQRKVFEAAKEVDALVRAYVRLSETEGAIARINADVARAVADLDTQITKLQASIVKRTLDLQKLNVKRLGLALSAAGAWSGRAPNDVIGRTASERVGFWITPSYKTKVGAASDASDEAALSSRALTALGVVRYLSDRTDGSKAWDVGGRLVFEISGSIAVSGEAVGRWDNGTSTDEKTWRAVGIVETKLADNAYLFASFGRDFTEEEQERSLVSIIGINFGFGKKPTVKLDE
jgi:hypothetical protein